MGRVALGVVGEADRSPARPPNPRQETLLGRHLTPAA
jgi:hypothetical protein